MKFADVKQSEIAGEWSAMLSAIGGAIRCDEIRTPKEVRDELERGEMTAYRITDGATGYVITQSTGDWYWILYAGGSFEGQAIRKMRGLMAAIAGAAEQNGFSQIHILGRWGWQKILGPLGFYPVGGDRKHRHLRKVL